MNRTTIHTTSGYNLGIELLRSIACFTVVLVHFGGASGLPTDIQAVFVNSSMFPVPAFMFLSFFFMQDFFLNSNGEKIKKRLVRLLVPYIFWPLIYFLCFNAVNIFLSKNCGLPLRALFWQLSFGTYRKFNSPLWFQVVLIFLTLIYLALFKFMNVKKAVCIVSTSIFLALLLEYSGLNYRIFSPLRYEMRYPLGRFCEMLPYAALGFLCSYYGIFERLRQNKTIALIMSGTFLLILLRMALLPTAAGFGYSVGNCIPLVFFLVVFSYFLPLEHLPTALKSMLSFCTRYTLGIYCMHMLAGRLLDALLHACNINLNRFLFCIIVYEVCFVFSFCIAGLGRMSKKKPVRIFTHLVE